jgi:excisionase family DNA binding protein
MEFNQDKHIGMTMKEAAVYLRVSISTIKRGTKDKDIPHFKIRKKPLYDKAKLDSYLKGYQSGSEMDEIYKLKIDPVKPTGHDKNGDQPEGIYKPKQDPKKLEGLDKDGDKGNQPKEPKKQNGPHKNAYGGGQSEDIYKPKNDPKKPDGLDKNGSGGGDHGQSL